MAKSDMTLGDPTSDVGVELYYAVTEDTGLTQVFGLQGIPVISAAKEDVTYRTLESDEEFAVKGRRPRETIEITLVSQRKQHDALKALANSDAFPWWYVKLPDSYTAAGESKPKVIKWKGSVDLTFAEISLDGMIQDTLTLGKSTIPEEIDGLPSSSSI